MDRHSANRLAMARRLADWIEANVQLDPADRLAAYETADDTEWARTAELAGEKHNPSSGTRACVLIALRERARPLDARLLEGLPR